MPPYFSQMKTENESLCKGIFLQKTEGKSIRPILSQLLCMLNIPLTETPPFSPVLQGSAQPPSQVQKLNTRACCCIPCMQLCHQRAGESVPANTQRQGTTAQKVQAHFGAADVLVHKQRSLFRVPGFIQTHDTYVQARAEISLTSQKKRFACHTPFEGTTASCCSQNSTVLITKPSIGTSSPDFAKYTQLRPSLRHDLCNFRFPVQQAQG